MIFGLGVGAVILFARTRTRVRSDRLGWRSWKWVAWWHLLVFGLILAGGFVGSLLFLLVGTLPRLDYTASEMAFNGLRDGAFFALIWAPGISLVACVMQAYRRNRDDQNPAEAGCGTSNSGPS